MMSAICYQLRHTSIAFLTSIVGRSLTELLTGWPCSSAFLGHVLFAGILFAAAEAASHGRALATLSLGSGVALSVSRLRGGGIDVVRLADGCRQVATGPPINGT